MFTYTFPVNQIINRFGEYLLGFLLILAMLFAELRQLFIRWGLAEAYPDE
jgi:hypothetical protein